ncbi:hypothetical protein CBS101457_003399 [Exobasidium rhododendri]|nr:hypothetical protein CBS101457_003399 [Exobasidium rhododendri]
MAPKRSSLSSSNGVTSIAKTVGRGAKNASLKEPLTHKKVAAMAPPPTTQEVVYTKEQLAKTEGKEDLNPDDSRYNALWDDVKRKMGMPKNAPIHSEHMNRIEHILRVFDLDPAYGPCLGMSRLERWERAEKLGDEPPSEIKEILETKQGVLELHQSVLADKGV